MEVAARLAAELGAHLDAREGQTPGAKFFHWERRGVPVVFELGPRDVASGKIVIKRRDTGSQGSDSAGPRPRPSSRTRWKRCRRTSTRKPSSV